MTDPRSTTHFRKRVFLRPILSLLSGLSVALLLIISVSTAFAARQAPSFYLLPGSISPKIAGAQMVSHHKGSDRITIGLLLRANNQAGIRDLVATLYNPHSSLYHHWLRTGEFDARFGPSISQVSAAEIFLTQSGLHVAASSPSTSLLLASGTINQVEAAFHTSINDYRSPEGQLFFANSTNVLLPASLSQNVIGVLGLTNAASERTHHRVADRSTSGPKLPPPYGGGPFGRGLTPSQIAGIYDATPVYKQLNDQGQGITLAVFELSNYTQSDIGVYEKQFNLRHVPIQNKLVLGGTTDHSGAGEVELDIELQIALAPGAKNLLVYQAANTELGVVAQYMQIAKDNQADSISTSWGLCEYLATSSIKLGEFQAFAQMATQGQSIFDASGDNGAFDCLPFTDKNLTGANELQVDDPGSQPYMTAVGGTSFQGPKGVTTFDPGKNQHPTYPPLPAELTWTDGCPTTDCAGGASGGGVSRYWGSPDYQYFAGFAPPGVVQKGFSQFGTYCNQTAGVLCREVPDVSINGDPSTGYAIYCTDKGDSSCSDPNFDIHGWIRFGGTSCGAPLWAAITALIDRQSHGRQGLLNYFFYSFDSPAGYSSQFHDITLFDNGHYLAGKTYDMSTGIGSPDIFHLVKP